MRKSKAQQTRDAIIAERWDLEALLVRRIIQRWDAREDHYRVERQLRWVARNLVPIMSTEGRALLRLHIFERRGFRAIQRRSRCAEQWEAMRVAIAKTYTRKP